MAAIIDFPEGFKMNYSRAVFISAFLVFGCCPSFKILADRPQKTPRTTLRQAASRDLAALIRDLRAQGATVKLSKESVAQPFFSTRGRIIYVNGESVWVFAYRTTAVADKDAAKITPDGMTIGNSKPSWLGTPHFFRRPHLIVLYLGDNLRVLDALTRVLGQQFAAG